MDYYLQQKIDNVRYYADQQKAEIDRRAAQEIKTLIDTYNAQLQTEIDQALRNLA